MPRRRRGGHRHGGFLPSTCNGTMVVGVPLPLRLGSPYLHPLAVFGSPLNYLLVSSLVMMSMIMDFLPPSGRHIHLATLQHVSPLVMHTGCTGLSCLVLSVCKCWSSSFQLLLGVN